MHIESIFTCMYVCNQFLIYGHLICLYSCAIIDNVRNIFVFTALSNLLLQDEFLVWIRLPINNRNVFLIVLEADSLRSGCQPGPILERTLFQVVDCWPLVVFSHGREQTGGKLSYNSYKGINLVHESYTPMTSYNPNDFPKASPPNTTALEPRVSEYTFWEHANI